MIKCMIHREFTFEASHMIPTLPSTHACGRLHGHTYRVEVWASGEIDDDPNGVPWHTDFNEIDEAAAEWKRRADHRHLNHVPPAALPHLRLSLAPVDMRDDLGSASAERIAIVLLHFFKSRIKRVCGIRLWEGSTASVVVGETR